MKNFLGETQAALLKRGYSSKNIKFIGSRAKNQSCTWDEFVSLSNFEYDSGYGGHIIRGDLIIVMDDGSIFKRGEYDGSEWWELHEPFKELETSTKMTDLKSE